MNIYFMGISFYGYAPHQIPLLSDQILQSVSNFFIEGRFISLFSILFGVGLYIQFQRFSNKGLAAYSLLSSRLKWLIVFGLLHGIIIWPGDILLTYGISGFLVLCYRDASIDELKRKANIFIFIANQLLLHLIQVGYMALVIPFTLMWFTAGLMLLGMALYQQGIFEQGFDRNTLLKLALATLVLSSMDTLLGLTENPILVMFSDILVMLSAIPMALIYIHIMVYICQNRSTVLKPLQNVGKLAFSLYILQSIVGVFIFRHFAPELLLTLNRGGYMAIALGYSLLQLLLASVYLCYFKQGPLEKLWRHLAFKSISP